MPKFSVIIPLYNKEKDFPLTLDSVLEQSFRDFELIIVNDGSTDGSMAIAEKAAEKDQRIRLFNNTNSGVSSSRNFGVARAKAKYIAFIDADDLWLPNHLENLHAILLKFPDATWFATAYEKKINHSLTRPMLATIPKEKNWIGTLDFFEYSLIDSLAHPSAVGFKKDFYNEIGGQEIGINFSEDTDLWIRAALSAPIYFSNTVSATIILNATNRANDLMTTSRKLPDYDIYEVASRKSSSLKKYLDVHFFSIALNYKMAGDNKKFKAFKNKIDTNSLNKKQLILLKTPKGLIATSKFIKRMLEKFGFYFSAYK